jgi:hypothetical protein
MERGVTGVCDHAISSLLTPRAPTQPPLQPPQAQVQPQDDLAAAAGARLPRGPPLPEPLLPRDELGGAGACCPHSYESGLTVHTHLQATHNSGASGASDGSASLPLPPLAPLGPLQGAAQQQQQPPPVVLDLRGPSRRGSAFSVYISAAAGPRVPPAGASTAAAAAAGGARA